MTFEWKLRPLPRIDDFETTMEAYEAEGWEVVGFPVLMGGAVTGVALRRPRTSAPVVPTEVKP